MGSGGCSPTAWAAVSYGAKLLQSMTKNRVKFSFAAVELINVRENDLTVLLSGVSTYGVAFQPWVASFYDMWKCYLLCKTGTDL